MRATSTFDLWTRQKQQGHKLINWSMLCSRGAPDSTAALNGHASGAMRKAGSYNHMRRHSLVAAIGLKRRDPNNSHKGPILVNEGRAEVEENVEKEANVDSDLM